MAHGKGTLDRFEDHPFSVNCLYARGDSNTNTSTSKTHNEAKIHACYLRAMCWSLMPIRRLDPLSHRTTGACFGELPSHFGT